MTIEACSMSLAMQVKDTALTEGHDHVRRLCGVAMLPLHLLPALDRATSVRAFQTTASLCHTGPPDHLQPVRKVLSARFILRHLAKPESLCKPRPPI